MSQRSRSKSRSRSRSRSKSSNGLKLVAHVYPEEKMPISDEDPIRPTPEEGEWTAVIKKSRKKRGLEDEPLPPAFDTLDLSNASEALQACDALLRTSKTIIRRERRHAKAEHIRQAQAENMTRWTKRQNPGTQLGANFVHRLQGGLATFFKPGYDKYKNELRVECGLPEVAEDAESTPAEVAQCVNGLLQKYGIIISGGFILKFISPMDDSSKPSIDCDLYLNHTAPERFPNLYEIMAKLFCCDVIPDMHGHMHNDVDAFMTHKMQGAKSGFLQKNGIFSVHKHRRTVNGQAAEMDLVRASTSRTAENIVRNFDLSVCMNWYDGEHLTCMDPEAIFHPKEASGFLQFSYVPILLGLASAKMVGDTRGRILKYIMRGYRVSYVNPRSGDLTEIVVSTIPNALKALLSKTDRTKRKKTLQNALLKITAKNRTRLFKNNPNFLNVNAIPSPKKKKPKSPKITEASLD